MGEVGARRMRLIGYILAWISGMCFGLIFGDFDLYACLAGMATIGFGAYVFIDIGSTK